MGEENKNDLDSALDFIAEIKESEFIRANSPVISVPPRMNEPSVFSEDEDELILSFCN